jgi:type VI secretion system (T6SS) immunity protein Tdi1
LAGGPSAKRPLRQQPPDRLNGKLDSNDELVTYRDAALASDFFDEWSQANPEQLSIRSDTCVGYRVPLFLGGSDMIENLEIVDKDVYWSIYGQLRRGSAGLPPNTSIAEITRAKPPE